MRGYCERCEVEVETEYDDPKLRRWVKGYFFLGLPFIPLTPIIFSEITVMLPMFMVYVIGFGPALGVLREPAKCCECGAAVDRASASPG
jgi:hypothetical protein